MTERSFIDRQRAVVRDLIRLSGQRLESQSLTERDFRSGTESAEREFHAALRSLEKTLQADTKAADAVLADAMRRIKSQFEVDHKAMKETYESSRRQILQTAEVNEKTAKKALEEAVWLTETVFEAGEKKPAEEFEQVRKTLHGRIARLQAIEGQGALLLRRYRQPVPSGDAQPADADAPPDSGDPAPRLEQAVADAQAQLVRLDDLTIPGLFQGMRPFGLALLAAIIPAAATFWLKGSHLERWQPIAIAAGAGLAAAIFGGAALYSLARSKSHAVFRALLRDVQIGRRAFDRSLLLASEQRDLKETQLAEQRDRELREAEEKYRPIPTEIKQRRDYHVNQLDEKYPRLLKEIEQRRDTEAKAAQDQHSGATLALKTQFESEAAQLRKRYEGATSEQRTRHDTRWNDLAGAWKEGTAAAHKTRADLTEASSHLFPAWNDPSWENWRPLTTFAPVVRFGQLQVDMNEIPGGVTDDARLATSAPTSFALPAVLEFPDRCSLLVEAGEEGRTQAVETLQNVMLRLLTSLPPGKVRFTIIDPVGLGQNFAGFMHLADYEEAIVGEKIWTETRHIEQRLTDLTEHMENVIQKYLRNEFETIGQYNERAGEIAEPFRFLVIANFPVNFSDTAARRLASVAASGARCGVYTLISLDTRQALPQGFQAADLRKYSLHLAHEKGRFVYKDEDFQSLPLTLDAPPDADQLTRIVRLVGQQGRDSNRVQVPFAAVAPGSKQLWTGDCGVELRVPLGRSGATKLQNLSLGTGTSHHALIAGKTGSGKSTLLHVLITNLALWYSPDEIEFYLVDFKKGVEFKTYATHELPHARAVAIESDREFGLSVLQRLDAELKNRGNKFRDAGVQDLNAYRKSPGAKPMPRSLLIVDEFQEFFIEDDKLGQDAALLLDRLVRQGRAFGIHVILGSQTLGGAYSLARSTIGQMGVRIALQCSEADSYLILSDDNSAARLLSRPGEAIYNSASGAVEGNSPFQIVWLPDEDRETHLKRVADLARQRKYQPPEPQIVFEGNVPADIVRNHSLTELLHRPQWPETTQSARAWLGEAIAIKDPTAAVFRKQSGNNMLIVGQRDEAAMAAMATSMISLAAQYVPKIAGATQHAGFVLLDASPPDAPHANYLAGLREILPHEVNVVAWRDIPTAMADLASSIERRHAGTEPDSSPIFVFIYGLQRFRMLRPEDEFGFSSGDGSQPPSAAKQFAAILRDGPSAGIHTIAWCDTMNNVNRMLERQGLKEFEMRVLFQMSNADSSNLIDSPLASRLGLRRALFYNEEQGHLEKFRPYALPPDEWLALVRDRLGSRGQAPTPGKRSRK